MAIADSFRRDKVLPVKVSDAVVVEPWKRWDIILASVVMNTLSLVLPLSILQFYDRVIPNHSYSTLFMFAMAILLAIVMESILMFARSTVLTWVGIQYENKMSIEALDHLLHARLTESNRMGVGEHIHNVESMSTLREFKAGQGFISLIDLPFLFLYFGLIYYFVHELVMIPIVVTVVFVLMALMVGRKLRHVLDERHDVDDRRYNFMIEIFSNHHTLKAMGLEEVILRRFERISKQSSEIEYRVNHYSHEAREVGALFSYVMFVSLVAFAASQVITYTISVGAMAACIVLSNRIIQPVQAILGLWARYQYFQIARKRLADIQSLATEKNANALVDADIEGALTIQDMTFQYDESHAPILKNVHLDIKPGQLITIRGNNGAGKSTLMRLIMGHLHPTSGQILIDGHPHSDYPIQLLRRNMIYLEPQGVLFQGTIMQNITLFRAGPVVDVAKHAARQLGLDQWVSQLPQGYETQIGDNLFSLLPAGIQQRICLARALVIHPKILILDEANTALDLKGDEDLKNTLLKLKGHMTILVVTHRPSLDFVADACYEVLEGHLTKRALHIAEGGHA